MDCDHVVELADRILEVTGSLIVCVGAGGPPSYLDASSIDGGHERTPAVVVNEVVLHRLGRLLQVKSAVPVASDGFESFKQ